MVDDIIITFAIQFKNHCIDVRTFSISLYNHAIILSIYSMMEPFSVTFMHIQVYLLFFIHVKLIQLSILYTKKRKSVII